MILVLAGTKDGRDLITGLSDAGYQVIASVFSQYGGELITRKNVIIHTGPLDADGLRNLIMKNGVTILVDASHPYAVHVSQNAMSACQIAGIHYLRYERPSAVLPIYEGLHVVFDYEQAINIAASLGKVVFLTTGSRHLKLFKDAPCLQNHRLIARVLSEPSVLTECVEMGFLPKDIIAMQGPFTHELNKALFKDYQAEVIVTKNSGQVGGSDTKITAAMDLGLPIVLIDRPAIEYKLIVDKPDDVLKFVRRLKF